MKHTTTISALDALALNKVEKERIRINPSRSRLNGLTALFLELFKYQKPSLMVHQSETRIQESYNAYIGDFQVKLIVLAYNVRDSVPSLIKQPSTALQINALRNHLIHHSNAEFFDAHIPVFDFPTKAFGLCGQMCQYQVDIDEGLWTIWFCDATNRTSACLEIAYSTLVEEANA